MNTTLVGSQFGDEGKGRMTEVLGADPWRFRVRVPLDGAALAAELDHHLEVVESRTDPAEE